ncbi:hypothetical protein HOI83_02155 [Candidatus Uhrbacteria bacterium]|jgi:hypothetical protein|nr:hypothetical protein [Candidatus Uhrbacteria bacterium]
MARKAEQSPDPSHFDKLADTSAVEKRRDTIRKGELETPNFSMRMAERMGRIARSKEDVVDRRGKVVGRKHIRRRKLDGRMSEARAEFTDKADRVGAVVLSEYETGTGEMRRHERQTPDGKTLRVVERDSADFYFATDFDEKRAGENPVRRDEFNPEGEKIGSARMKYKEFEVDGESEFMLTEETVDEMSDGEVVGRKRVENSYDKTGRILEESMSKEGAGYGKVESTATHKYEDDVELVSTTHQEYSQAKDEPLVKSSEGDKRFEGGLLQEESSRMFSHSQVELSESAQRLYKEDPAGTLRDFRSEGRQVRSVIRGGEKVIVEVTKTLVQKSEKSFRYDDAGQLTGDTETMGNRTTVSEHGYKKGRRDSSTRSVDGEHSQTLQYKYGGKSAKPDQIIVNDAVKEEVRSYRLRQPGDKRDRSAPEEGYVLDVAKSLAA